MTRACPATTLYPDPDQTLSLAGSDVYGDNEDLLGKYFKHNPSARSKVFLATKFAAQFDGKEMTVDSSPEYCSKALEKSLQRLGVESVDLYYV